MKDFQYSFELWEDIPPVISYYDTPRVSVSEKGLFAMNGAMRRNVGDQRAFRVKISPDGYYLALCTEQAPNVQFSRQSGHTTHRRLKELLREKGILLPAVYTMEWHEERRAWIGHCQELPPPPDSKTIRRVIKNQEKRTGRGNA